MKIRNLVIPMFLAIMLVMTGKIYAQGEVKLANLAKERGVLSMVVDENGEVVKGPDATGDLRDGKGRTGGMQFKGTDIARLRFDLLTPVEVHQINVDQRYPQKGHYIDKFEIYIGNDPDNLPLVHTISDHPKTFENKDAKELTLDIPPSTGRYVQINVIQEPHPDHNIISLREVEILGPASMKGKIATAPPALLDMGGTGSDIVAAAMGIPGAITLTYGMDEADVRSLLKNSKAQQVFIIQPGAYWILKDTLIIPDEVTVIGFHKGRSGNATFVKGFDGPLAHIGSWVTLHGLSFDGNKKEFKGDGLVDPIGKGSPGIREQRFIRVEVRNCEGSGFVFTVPHYYSYYQFCTFDHNDGYGLVYGEVRAHHTDNVYDSCHWGWNRKGGVAFHAVEASSIWENCEFFHNGGAAFEHFLINKKLGNGRPIGPRPGVGAGALVIRNSVIRNCAAPVWLNRGGRSESIVFEDCRLKHNGHPRECTFTKDSGQSVEEMFGLTGPVGGLVHVEGGQVFAEIRGGFAWDNSEYFFTTSPNSDEGSRITVSGAARSGHITGGIYAPNGYANIQDTSLLKEDAVINVKSGIGLDPIAGKVVSYGPVNP